MAKAGFIIGCIAAMGLLSAMLGMKMYGNNPNHQQLAFTLLSVFTFSTAVALIGLILSGIAMARNSKPLWMPPVGMIISFGTMAWGLINMIMR